MDERRRSSASEVGTDDGTAKKKKEEELQEVDKMAIHSAQSWVHKKQREVKQRTGGAE